MLLWVTWQSLTDGVSAVSLRSLPNIETLLMLAAGSSTPNLSSCKMVWKGPIYVQPAKGTRTWCWPRRVTEYQMNTWTTILLLSEMAGLTLLVAWKVSYQASSSVHLYWSCGIADGGPAMQIPIRSATPRLVVIMGNMYADARLTVDWQPRQGWIWH